MHIAVVNAVAWFHVIGVDVSKPSYASTDRSLEVLAVLVKENKVVLGTIRFKYQSVDLVDDIRVHFGYRRRR